MARLTQKLKGYVLMESVFAMVIIMSCFITAFLVINTMTENQRSYLIIKAEIALKYEAERCKHGQLLFDEELQRDGFHILRRVHEHPDNEHLLTLELKAMNADGKTITEYYEFILAP